MNEWINSIFAADFRECEINQPAEVRTTCIRWQVFCFDKRGMWMAKYYFLDFTALVQRIFNCGKIQSNYRTDIKYWTFDILIALLRWNPECWKTGDMAVVTSEPWSAILIAICCRLATVNTVIKHSCNKTEILFHCRLFYSRRPHNCYKTAVGLKQVGGSGLWLIDWARFNVPPNTL